MKLHSAIKKAAFGIILSCSIASLSNAQDDVTMVGADQVTMRAMSQTVPVSGRLVARQAGVVAARITAPIKEILVDVGDHVQAQQPLLRLVSDRLLHQKELRSAELARAEAALQTAKAQLNIVSQEYQRLQRLRKSAAFNQARSDDKRLEQIKARSTVVEAEAAVTKAKADLSLAELDLAYTEIKAPYPGTITLRHVDLGDYVSVGQTLITLVNADNLEIEADVPTNRIKELKVNTPVTATLASGNTFPTLVRAIVPEENPLTRTRAVRFTPDRDLSGLQLASNQTLTVSIPVGGNREVLSVAKDAILNKKGNQIVFAIKDGKATITPVTLGDAFGGYFEVLSGLQEGDLVIVRGNERLRPGQAVAAQGS